MWRLLHVIAIAALLGSAAYVYSVKYQTIYSAMRPVLPLLLRMFPKQITTTEQVGRAMLTVAKRGYPKQVLESADISTAAV